MLVLRQILTHLRRDAEAIDYSFEAIEMSNRLGDQAGTARGLWNLAGAYLGAGDLVASSLAAKQAASIAESLGLRLECAYAYSYLASAELYQCHHENARRAGRKGLTFSREANLQHRVVWSDCAWNVHMHTATSLPQNCTNVITKTPGVQGARALLSPAKPTSSTEWYGTCRLSDW
jgi:hypothetical protein